MLIIGARGFAKEVLEVCHQNNDLENLSFYDDINEDTEDRLYHQFSILRSMEQAAEYFQIVDHRFTIGIGNPKLRAMLTKKFTVAGGILTSTISPSANIGSYDITINEGCNILPHAIIANSTTIGKGCVIYYSVLITHDCIIKDFVELSPGVTVLGRAEIGSFTQVGANSTILPDVKIGNNVVIGAGAVVTKDLPDNCLAVGIPAKIIKQN